MAPSVTARAHMAFPELRADRPYHQPRDDSCPWWRRISSSGAAPPRRSLPRRGSRSSALSNRAARISPASNAHRDLASAVCGSGDARQHRPPFRSDTAACSRAVLRPGRATTSAAARSRRAGSRPTTWNAFLPMSMPIVATVKLDLLDIAVLLCWSSHPSIIRSRGGSTVAPFH